MIELKERYVIDEGGAQVAVLLDIEDYRKIIESLEELDAIRVYDEAKASPERLIPFQQAIKEIESCRL